jgi:hypothetical protein
VSLWREFKAWAEDKIREADKIRDVVEGKKVHSIPITLL